MKTHRICSLIISSFYLNTSPPPPLFLQRTITKQTLTENQIPLIDALIRRRRNSLSVSDLIVLVCFVLIPSLYFLESVVSNRLIFMCFYCFDHPLFADRLVVVFYFFFFLFFFFSCFWNALFFLLVYGFDFFLKKFSLCLAAEDIEETLQGKEILEPYDFFLSFFF